MDIFPPGKSISTGFPPGKYFFDYRLLLENIVLCGNFTYYKSLVKVLNINKNRYKMMNTKYNSRTVHNWACSRISIALESWQHQPARGDYIEA